jgi:hypothetical protein
MSAITLLLAAAVIIMKIYFTSTDTTNDEIPLSSNYWMVHDPKYNPYNT